MRILEIEWLDAATSHGWQKDEQIPARSKVRSVGYVIRDEKDYITLCESLDESIPAEDQVVSKYGCATTIPKVCITSQRELSVNLDEIRHDSPKALREYVTEQQLADAIDGCLNLHIQAFPHQVSGE